ncbi:hypothetical protein C7S13_8345 [Burkholderia cepacia]|nr:hypothetical protein [Burkholderia cepacia]
MSGRSAVTSGIVVRTRLRFEAELFNLRAANATLLRTASNRWGNR